MNPTGSSSLTAWLLGHPLSHSISPLIHKAAYEALGLNIEYLLADIRPHNIGTVLKALPCLGAIGANVTIPYKENIICYLDQVTEEAAQISAINTIVIRDNLLIGYNTDAPGWLQAWDSVIRSPLQGRRAVVLGAGGAAKAVTWGLCQRKVKAITILNRHRDKAEHLLQLLQKSLQDQTITLQAEILRPDTFRRCLNQDTVVINTTPLGMKGFPPWPDSWWPLKLPPRMIAVDLVYNPPNPSFLIKPERQGLQTMNGLEMLIRQAALAIQLWTGRFPPLEPMRQAALKALGHLTD